MHNIEYVLYNFYPKAYKPFFKSIEIDAKYKYF